MCPCLSLHYLSAGEVYLEWYTTKYDYDYYLTTSLTTCGLLLILIFYYFTTNVINSVMYLYQQWAERIVIANTRPKPLVSVRVHLDSLTSPGRDVISLTSPGGPTEGADRDVIYHSDLLPLIRKEGGYIPLLSWDRPTLPSIAPLAVQEYFMVTRGEKEGKSRDQHVTRCEKEGASRDQHVTRCGLGTLLIKLPGQEAGDGAPCLVLGTTPFITEEKDLEFRNQDTHIRETCI